MDITPVLRSKFIHWIQIAPNKYVFTLCPRFRVSVLCVGLLMRNINGYKKNTPKQNIIHHTSKDFKRIIRLRLGISGI